MGVLMSKVLDRLGLSKKELQILMVGLDFVGKTTILNRLQQWDLVGTYPTAGFNFVRFKYKRFLFTVWDLGHGDKVRRFWLQHYPNAEGVMFVVDSTDKMELKEARKELLKLDNEDALDDAVLLVIANKQDLPTAMTVAELTDKLGLHSLTRRSWHIQEACATTGDGLYEGLDWLAANVAKKT